MSGYIIRRLLQTVVVVLIVSFISFSLVQIMPGDPVASMLGVEATKAQIDAMRIELGFDQPFHIQYIKWLYNALRGDLGISMMYREPVTDIFSQRLPITIYLSLLSTVFSSIVGIIFGIICAVRRSSFLDQLLSVSANIGIAIPVFWLGIICIYFFGLRTNLLPIYGWVSPTEDLFQNFRHALLPVLLLSIPGIAILTRQTRSSMLEIVRQDYIRTALSKGLKERVVVFRHALKNALIPVVTLMGLHLRVMFGGSVLIETVFNIPGMGRLLVTAAQNKDVLVVQGGVLLIGLIVCVANLLVDISYGWLDPRLRYE